MVRKYHVLAGAFATSAFAVTAPAVHAEQAIEEIVVTGSYIRRAPEDAPSPIRVLGREEMETKGLPQLSDMIATLPSVVGSENQTAQDQSVRGAGTANINIRNLGAASTLVLLDGKRMNTATSKTNQGEEFVDINRLPFIMIENIEILKDGASALYGSDAVAGVANFKLRNRFEGFEIQGMYQDTFQGRQTDFDKVAARYNSPAYADLYRGPVNNIADDDGSDMDLGAIWGFGNDTTHFVIGFNYFEREGTDTVDRDFALDAVLNPASPGAPSPFNLPQDQFGYVDGDLAGMVMDTSCETLGHNRSRLGGLCATKNDLLSRDMFSEESRKQMLATWSHDINDRIEAYGHFGFSENNVVLNQSPTLPVVGVSYSTDNPGLRHAAANQYGAPVDPDSFEEMVFNGVVRPSIVNLQNAMGVSADYDGDGIDDGVYNNRESQTIDRESRIFMAGLRGDLNDEWQFDASYNFSKEESDLIFRDTVVSRVDDALNGYFGPACDKGSVADPTTPGNSSKGCYWFNPFGSSILTPDATFEDGNGVVHTLGNDPYWVDLLLGEAHVRSQSELTVLDAVVSTDSFMGWQLPGGSVGFALGAQYREETRREGGNELATDPGFPMGFTGPTIPYSATQDIMAVFAEFALPLTQDLEAQLALRYEDYGGATGDTVDPKLALRWQALDNLVLRGSVGTSFRGPSLTQKFAQSTGLQYVPGADDSFTAVFARLPTYGNEDLQPEESTNFNIGAVWDVTDSLMVSLDYFNYKYDDIIISEDFQAMANACQLAWAAAGRNTAEVGGAVNADTLGLPECNGRDFDNNAATPDVLLDSEGTPLAIQRTFVNGSELQTSGLDLTSRYTLATDYGIFGATLDLSWFLEYDIDRGGETIDLVGRSENVLIGRPLPELKGTMMVDYAINQHYAALVANYVDHVVEPNVALAGGAGDFRVASHTTFDAMYTYNFDRVDLSLTAGAVNLFDREPPTASGFNGYESTLHDPRGRLWYMRVRYGL